MHDETHAPLDPGSWRVSRLLLKSDALNSSLILRLSILIIILESSQLHTPDEDVHELHPVLKEKLSPNDKCWQTEEFEVIRGCDLCTKEEIFSQEPVVCVAQGRKELVECKKAKRQTYRR